MTKCTQNNVPTAAGIMTAANTENSKTNAEACFRASAFLRNKNQVRDYFSGFSTAILPERITICTS